MKTPGSPALPEPTTHSRGRRYDSIAAQISCCQGQLRNRGNPLVPLRKDCGFATGITIGVHRLRHSAVA